MAETNKNGLHGGEEATFEQSFGRLQEVVQRLTEGNLTLEEALSAFEEGMSLADRCTKMLDTAELRVKNVNEASARSAGDLAELEEVMRQTSPEDDVLSFEVESYRERITFEAPEGSIIPPSPNANLAYSPLPSERRPSKSRQPEENRKPASPAPSNGNLDELDPLFDEDD